MRAPKLVSRSEGRLIADYVDQMGESVMRRRVDIAARAARVEAELAIKARSEFLANMNHELRTPLNAIIGFGAMLREGEQYALGEDQKRSYVEYILQSADLLLGHINTLLDVAALESGGVELAHDAIDLGALLDEALERARIRAAAGGVALERYSEKAGVDGWGDAERTGQAVDHLLQVAIKTSGKGGRVLVRVRRDDKDWGEIAVRDDGDGMTAAELANALDAFKETPHSLDRSFLGPGVGYAIAKTFVEMQGGRFAIKSRKGQGTLARICLPPPREKAKADDGAGSEPQEPRTVDDDRMERANDAA